jgi:hypothetical protein
LERTAKAFDEAARLADYRASLYQAAGHSDDATREREGAARSREAARRARADAFRKRGAKS